MGDFAEALRRAGLDLGKAGPWRLRSPTARSSEVGDFAEAPRRAGVDRGKAVPDEHLSEVYQEEALRGSEFPVLDVSLEEAPGLRNLLSGTSWRQRLGAGAATGLLAVCALFAWSGYTGDEFDPGPTATAERERIERIVVATGTIEPEREVEVRPRIAGIVEHILIEAGDEVLEGQLLVEIEAKMLASQVREAEAALRGARIEQRYAKIELDRIEELRRAGVASSRQHDAARLRFEGAEAALSRAAARLSTLSTQLGYASVRSPLAGRVLDVHTEEGNAVSPVTAVTGGTLLLSLAATDKLHLKGLVDENEVARVELGQPARIRTEAFGDRVFQGSVREIAPMGQRIQNVTYFEVEIEIIDDEAGELRPRMSGDADIVTGVVEDSVTIPETALRYRGNQIYVETVTRDGANAIEPRTVTIGIVDGTRVQVLDGLEAGEEVTLQ